MRKQSVQVVELTDRSGRDAYVELLNKTGVVIHGEETFFGMLQGTEEAPGGPCITRVVRFEEPSNKQADPVYEAPIA